MSLNGSHRANVSVMTLVKLHNSPVVCRGYVCKHTCWKFYTPLYQHLSCSAWNQYTHICIVPPPPDKQLHLLCGQLFSEFGLFLLHAAKLLLLPLETQVRSFAAIRLHRRALGTPQLPRAHHVSAREPLGSRGVAHKVEIKSRKGIWKRSKRFAQRLCDPYSTQQECSNAGHSALNYVHGCSREVTYACVCQEASVQWSPWVERPPAPTPLRCCCRCKTHSACSRLLSLADKTWSS